MTRLPLSLLFALNILLLCSFGAHAQADSAAKAPAPMMDYTSVKKYVLNDIRVHGVKYLDPEVLAISSGLNKGDTVYLPGSYISDAIRKLWDQRFFSDVKIMTDIEGDQLNLDIYLTERPRVYKWDITGVRPGQKSDMIDNLGMKRGSELSDFAIKTYSDGIKRYMEEKGYRNAEVEVTQRNDSVMKNAVNVVFNVIKGSKVKIGKISFTGNEVFGDGRLAASMKKTKAKKLMNMFKSSKFKEKEYEEDKDNLIDFYNSKGYRNATIVDDSVYDINKKRIGISITVDEGNKYYYRNVTWSGNSKYDTDMLNNMLGIKKGETYDKRTMHKRLGIGKEASPDDVSVTSLYQNDGYLFFQIDPSEVVIGSDSIDVNLKLFEGKQARINEIKITGNMRVDDEVIRRELYTRPGDLYNRSLLMSTLRQLGQMQHFNPEALMPGVNPVSNELVDITFPLEEQASDKFEISGGWGAGMFVGSVGVQLNNVSLKRFFKKNTWKPYPSGQNQQIAIRGQTNGSYYKALSLSFTEPWLGGRKPNSLTVGLYYSDETNAYYMWQKGTKHFRTIGGSVGLGRRLSWPDQYFTLYNELGYQSYNLKDWDYFILNNGSANIISFKTVFGRNSVDQPIYPRRGSDFSVALTLTPPYSLFQDIDYSDPNLPNSQRYKWIEFYKWELKGQWFYPLTRNNNLVLMAKAEMGYLGAYNKDKPSPFEGFDMGGDGMSGYNVYGVDIIGLRGYENGSLTPYSNQGDYARAYNKYTLELRYPFILKPSATIYGLVFAEGGNAFPDWQSFNPFQLKRSAGLGVRLYLPIVGMIGFDFGYGFDRVPYTGQKGGWQPHFIIGNQF